jgi:hypothetical protein
MIKFFKDNIIFFASSIILAGYIASLLTLRKTFGLNQPENINQASVNSSINIAVPLMAPSAVSFSTSSNKVTTKKRIKTNTKRVSKPISLPSSLYRTNFKQQQDLHNERDDD